MTQDTRSNREALDLLKTKPLDMIDSDWARALHPWEQDLQNLGVFLWQEFLKAQETGHRTLAFLPAPRDILRVFQQPLMNIKVLVVGQDPYPTPGHPIGLSFAVERQVRPIPRSLSNIYQELADDLQIPPAPHGDLSAWAAQGVMLLNRVLSVRPGASGSHRGRGWETITEAAIRTIVHRRTPEGKPYPLVAMLWGNDARSLIPMLDGAPTIASAHPSPLSANRGFFGSKPFSRCNTLLERQGAASIDWRVL